MVRNLGRIALAVAAAAAAFAWPATRAARAASQPTVTLSTASLVPGQFVTVEARGWSAGTVIQLQLCGQNAIDGSVDCAQDAALTVAPGPGGDVTGQLLAELPPEPCPCVVLVQTLPGVFSETIPVAVAGAAIKPVQPKPVPTLAVGARVTGGTTIGSFFGFGSKRTLVLTIRNSAIAGDAYPVVSAGWGRSSKGLSTISAPAFSALAPGHSVTVRLSFNLQPFSFGSYTVRGTVAGGVRPSHFRTSTSTVPWGLILAGVVLLQAFLLLLRNRLRARLTRDDETSPTPPEDPVEPAVVDLTEAPLAPPPDSWTTTERFFFSVAERGLSCSVERLACPSVGLVRTHITMWDAYTCAPWEAVYDDVAWASVAGREFDPDRVRHDSPGLHLDAAFTPDGPALSLGGRLAARRGHAGGHVSVGGETFLVDSCAVSVMAWTAEAENWHGDDGRTVSYGVAEGAWFCLAQPGSSGWLMKDGITARLVEVERSVDDRLGPYVARLTVKLRDELGRTIEVTGRTNNGFATRVGDEHLALSCSTDWDIDGIAAVGEDWEWMSIATWKSLRTWAEERAFES